VVVTGAERVARHLMHYWGPGATLVSHPVGGQPALLGFYARELSGVLVFTMRGEAIRAVHVIADPAKLGFLRLQRVTPPDTDARLGRWPAGPHLASSFPCTIAPGPSHCHPRVRPLWVSTAGRSGWRGGFTMSAQHGRGTTVSPAARAGSLPASSNEPAAPPRAARNAIRFGPRTRRVIRAIARVVNPLVLRIAGRRHMPILGIVHHRGRKTGRLYATPLGVRPAGGGGFVIPLTFSHASHWYQNILAAGSCVITYRGTDRTVSGPILVDRATAGPAYPHYERIALRLIGINEFVWLTDTPDSPSASAA
jgi:deazaflavin-dependent oxidoreductase (nitroreductase family)